MLIVLIAAALLFAVVCVLRNALTLVVACAGASAVWFATHDPPATCAAGVASLLLASMVLEAFAVSASPLLRGATITLEALTASVVAATMGFMLFHEGQSALALSITIVSAALLGAGLALSNRVSAR